jgi:hypothetical protein
VIADDGDLFGDGVNVAPGLRLCRARRSVHLAGDLGAGLRPLGSRPVRSEKVIE